MGRARRGATSSSDDAADAPARDIRKGAMIGAAFFVGLLGFAALTPLDAGATAEGVVAVSGSRQAVQHQQGGIVTDIRVTEGQAVRKGDVILKISASDAVAIERGLTSDYIAAVAQRARLVAEASGRSNIPEPREYAGLSAEDRLLASEALERPARNCSARGAARSPPNAACLASAWRSTPNRSAATVTRSSRTASRRRLIGEELDGLRALLPKGYVSINRVRGDGAHRGRARRLARRLSRRDRARLRSDRRSAHPVAVARQERGSRKSPGRCAKSRSASTRSSPS